MIYKIKNNIFLNLIVDISLLMIILKKIIMFQAAVACNNDYEMVVIFKKNFSKLIYIFHIRIIYNIKI